MTAGPSTLAPGLQRLAHEQAGLEPAAAVHAHRSMAVGRGWCAGGAAARRLRRRSPAATASTDTASITSARPGIRNAKRWR
jgi:hypothetical protein